MLLTCNHCSFPYYTFFAFSITDNNIYMEIFFLMRTTVIEQLKELAKEDDKIALITGDSGYSVVETFIEKY